MENSGSGASPAPASSLSSAPPRRVLIAHQSTIPHYRVRFYELLEELRPAEWTFEVVYDPAESTHGRVYKEPVDHHKFKFPIRSVRTRVLALGGKKLIWQNYLRHLRDYDLLITDTHLANLSYPLGAFITHLRGGKWMLWGHVGDRNLDHMSAAKRTIEKVKRRYMQRTHGFLAYTPGERDRLLQTGFPAERIQVLNNTIDIRQEREYFEIIRSERNAIRAELGLTDCIVLLHVGRLIPGKRIDFLADTFRHLYATDHRYHLAVIGSGQHSNILDKLQHDLGNEAVSCPGAISDRARLGRWFTASDLFIMPGYVGLAPLQALCYDLPVVYFDLRVHSPEVEFLTAQNASCLPGNLSPQDAALEIAKLLGHAKQMGASPYDSIRHLTLEAMAENFIQGVNRALGIAPR